MESSRAGESWGVADKWARMAMVMASRRRYAAPRYELPLSLPCPRLFA